ncbi:MAG: DUF5334 family protein [Campylobacter sp.]|uniref:DUF5334 family protein n=1 Tax=Campylobacter TaxID=194 RepID=UPI001B03720B|nr:MULTISPECIES: DUF5334 family protein [Campylobacter]MBO5064189.1 DUF5334 family protein [Campylobacter sp.]MDL0095645.1 DUF5334 domain-containing protein [Campylobacter ovis]
MKKLLCVILCINTCLGWSGYDWENGSYVDIDKGNKVRAGRDIEIYDYKDGQYKDVEVQSVRKRYNGKTEIEIYDPSDNSYRTLDMDR